MNRLLKDSEACAFRHSLTSYPQGDFMIRVAFVIGSVPVVEAIGAPIRMVALLAGLGLKQSRVRWPKSRH